METESFVLFIIKIELVNICTYYHKGKKMYNLPEHKNRKEIPEYHTWKNMRARCNAPCNKENGNYQKNNITVCERWNDFLNFYNDMGPKPSNKHSIDRINNDGNYEPLNCRWANNTIQANNKSNNKLVNFDGKVFTISQLSEHLGLSRIALRKHLDKGRSAEEAISRINDNNFIEFNGIRKSRQEFCNDYGIKLQNFYSRINKGWSIERALTTKERKTPSNNK